MRTLRLALFAIFMIVGGTLLTTRGVALSLNNVGFVALNHALSKDELNSEAVRAEVLLRQVAEHNAENRSAWRGLGFALSLQGREKEALVAWIHAGEMYQEFIWRGQQAQITEEYSQTLQWYQRAARLQPERRDAWYYTGLVYAELGQSEKALEYYNMAVLKPDTELSEVGQSDVYCAMGWFFHWLAKPVDPDMALYYYDLAVRENSFWANERKADCYFKQAELLMWRTNMPGKAADSYEVVVELQPDDIYAVTTLILARYYSSGDLIRAESKLLEVIQEYPAEKWGYWRLGEVYRIAGRLDEAVSMYEKALTIDPTNEQLRSQLESLVTNNK